MRVTGDVGIIAQCANGIVFYNDVYTRTKIYTVSGL
jgi:hypothetical protein